MNVLSLFDGISCARVALDRAGIKVKTYYACEIEKNAIKISQKNYPDIRQLGDVRAVHTFDEPIHLLVGGSPCTDLSIAKKDRRGLQGEHSSLFWEYVRILKEVKPKYFILENVASMPARDKEIITAHLGVDPIMINASLVSAQSRKRFFWTNIPNVTQPKDRGILLKHILQPDTEVEESMMVKGKSFCLTASYHKTGDGQNEYEHNKKTKQRTMVIDGAAIRGRQNEEGEWIQTLNVRGDGKANALTYSHTTKTSMVKVGYIGEGEQYGQGGQAHRVYDPEGKTPTLSSYGPLIKLGHIGTDDAQANRVYDPEGKSCTLQANGGGLGAKTGLYAIGRDIGRRLNAEGHREDNNKDIPIQRRIEVREDEKSGTLTSVQKDNLVVNETRIRKLTPIECERLQGLPDKYTEGIAKTHRYKCLGNAFNVDVIAHILSFLPNDY